MQLLKYERKVMFGDGQEEEALAKALEDLDAPNDGQPPPSPAPTPDARPDHAEARRLAPEALRAIVEHRELMAEVEVYGSVEVSRLFTEFFLAQVDELAAVREAAAREDDDDTAEERRADRARQRQSQANFELSQEVRHEVADG